MKDFPDSKSNGKEDCRVCFLVGSLRTRGRYIPRAWSVKAEEKKRGGPSYLTQTRLTGSQSGGEGTGERKKRKD